MDPKEQASLVVSATSAKFTIPGWGDEQRLAVPGRSGLEYGPLARIVPQDTLERISDSAFAGTWVLVARVQTRSGYDKLKLGATTYDSAGGDVTTNSIWICRQLSDGRWHARVVRPDGAVHYGTVHYEPHRGAGEVVPGAARWLWRGRDEGAWMMCGSGCCSVYAFM